DIRLSGAMDGVDLAREAKMRWPHLTVVLTSGAGGERLQHLPPGVIYLSKPWQPLEVLGLAEQAKLSAQQRKIYGRGREGFRSESPACLGGDLKTSLPRHLSCFRPKG